MKQARGIAARVPFFVDQPVPKSHQQMENADFLYKTAEPPLLFVLKAARSSLMPDNDQMLSL